MAIAFPVYVHVAGRTIHPHFFFESLSYVIAFFIYLALRRRFGDPVVTPLRWAAVAAAVAGAALGSKVLYWFEDPQQTFANLHNPAYLTGGKTIVGALIGGLVAVELMKRYIGLRTSTGDLYAIPLAMGIAIGRIGCFLTGLTDNTFGTPTSLPWGVDFGDGIRRHPTQLYEIVFLVGLTPVLYRVLRSLHYAVASRVTNSPTTNDHRSTTVLLPGDAFKLFMVAYMTLRLLDDFIKPYPRVFLGLGGIQWACVLTLVYYSRDIARWLLPQSPAVTQ